MFAYFLRFILFFTIFLSIECVAQNKNEEEVTNYTPHVCILTCTIAVAINYVNKKTNSKENIYDINKVFK